jgi:hypothetical protein
MLLLGAAICLLPQKQAPKIVFENILKSSGIRYVTDNSATSKISYRLGPCFRLTPGVCS